MRFVRLMALVLATWPAFDGPSKVLADDLEGFFKKRQRLDDTTREKLDEFDQVRLLKAQQARENKDNSQVLEGVAQRMLLWDEDTSTLRVCFMDGDEGVWAEIASIVSQWTNDTRIRFDFRDETAMTYRRCSSIQAAEVRVSFAGGASYSEVGTKAKLLPNKFSTVTLGSISKKGPLTQEDKRVVLHESGHVLGLEHEHQGPSAKCEEEINWNYLYAYFGNRANVNAQIRSFIGTGNITGIFSSSFDRKSIMMYYLPREAFRMPDQATCLIETKNNSLSKIDTETIRELYKPH